MKRILFCFLFLFLGIAFTTDAQQQEQQIATTSTARVDEPEYSGAVYLLSNGKLTSLESQRPSVTSKVKNLGLGGASSAYVYVGAASPIRVASNAEFVMRLEGRADPVSLIVLSKMEQKNNARQIVIGKVNSMGTKSEGGPQNLEIKFIKYGLESVRITTAGTLAPGEYAFRTVSGVTYLFGVDPPDPQPRVDKNPPAKPERL
jgi:hypothetical protein